MHLREETPQAHCRSLRIVFADYTNLIMFNMLLASDAMETLILNYEYNYGRNENQRN
jgi:hypothetical protein